MRLSRAWATPLTIGAFIIMSVTGMLMFFHLNTGLNKLVHEWASWLMVGGVALHVIVNWRPFANYFLSGALGRALIGICVVALALSFLPLGGPRGGMSPPALAISAITGAPISKVADLAGKPVAEVMEELSRSGITLPSADASIASVTGKDRGAQAKALAILFGKGAE